MEKTKEIVSQDKKNPVYEMLQLAMTDSNVDLDKMDKIMQMAERHEAKIAERAYYSAMADLQGEMPEISKNGKAEFPSRSGGRVSYDFAKYEDIMRAIKPILLKHGFSASFRPKCESEKLIINCVVAHRAGHTEKSSIELPFDTFGNKNAIQSIGSSMSYGKKYALCLIFNIPVGGEDNDGNKPEKEPRSLKELGKMVSNASKIPELQMLWDGMTKQEREIAKEIVKIRKSELKVVTS